jgi:hypothetical protein
MVAGHAITTAESLDRVDAFDSKWSLLPYQRGQDLPAAFTSHIRKGVDLAAADPTSLLIFSGGVTRADAGPRSEALSYWLVAEHFGWWDSKVRRRAVLEDYAKDSFENLLFSICRFREVTGAWPSRITVVGYAFKATRFKDLHRAAIGFPEESFNYVGLQPPTESKFDLKQAEKVELSHRCHLLVILTSVMDLRAFETLTSILRCLTPGRV